jgi:protease YdgD
LRFRAGLRDGEVVAEHVAARSVADPDYRPNASDGAERVRHDVALLELDTPVSVADVAPFRVKGLPRGLREVGVVSYARGRDAAPSRQAACAVVGRQGGLMDFDCDVDFGSSGAPVFDRSGHRPAVVSIISAGRREGNGTLSFGMDLVTAVAVLRDALRTGRGVSVAAAGTETTFRRIRPGTADSGGARFVRP